MMDKQLMVETNIYARHQRSNSAMVKYCGEKGKVELKIRMKCVRCQRLEGYRIDIM